MPLPESTRSNTKITTLLLAGLVFAGHWLYGGFKGTVKTTIGANHRLPKRNPGPERTRVFVILTGLAGWGFLRFPAWLPLPSW